MWVEISEFVVVDDHQILYGEGGLPPPQTQSSTQTQTVWQTKVILFLYLISKRYMVRQSIYDMYK